MVTKPLPDLLHELLYEIFYTTRSKGGYTFRQLQAACSILGRDVSPAQLRHALSQIPVLRFTDGTYAYKPTPKTLVTTFPLTTHLATESSRLMAASNDDIKKTLYDAIDKRIAELEEQERAEQAAKEARQRVPRPKKNAKEGYTRPNGQKYLPRELAGGLSDVETLRKLRDAGIFTLLAGPPGTGKSALAEAAFGKELFTLTADEDTVPADFLGQFTADGRGGYTWVDGPLVQAMRSGSVLFVDDATLASPKTLAVLYPAMDGRGEVIVKGHVVGGKPDIVKAAKGFYVVAAHNPGVHGAILSDAFSSRFTVHIEVTSDLELAASLGVTDRFLKLVRNLETKRAEGDDGLWIPQVRELLAARDVAAMFGEEVAARNLLGVAPEEDREVIADAMNVIWGKKEMVPLTVGSQM